MLSHRNDRKRGGALADASQDLHTGRVFRCVLVLGAGVKSVAVLMDVQRVTRLV